MTDRPFVSLVRVYTPGNLIMVEGGRTVLVTHGSICTRTGLLDVSLLREDGTRSFFSTVERLYNPPSQPWSITPKVGSRWIMSTNTWLDITDRDPVHSPGKPAYDDPTRGDS